MHLHIHRQRNNNSYIYHRETLISYSIFDSLNQFYIPYVVMNRNCKVLLQIILTCLSFYRRIRQPQLLSGSHNLYGQVGLGLESRSFDSSGCDLFSKPVYNQQCRALIFNVSVRQLHVGLLKDYNCNYITVLNILKLHCLDNYIWKIIHSQYACKEGTGRGSIRGMSWGAALENQNFGFFVYHCSQTSLILSLLYSESLPCMALRGINQRIPFL